MGHEDFIKDLKSGHRADVDTNKGDGTITDSATGLMWSQDDRGDGVSNGPRSGMTWEEALAWVEQKNDENYLGDNTTIKKMVLVK